MKQFILHYNIIQQTIRTWCSIQQVQIDNTLTTCTYPVIFSHSVDTTALFQFSSMSIHTPNYILYPYIGMLAQTFELKFEQMWLRSLFGWIEEIYGLLYCTGWIVGEIIPPLSLQCRLHTSRVLYRKLEPINFQSLLPSLLFPSPSYTPIYIHQFVLPPLQFNLWLSSGKKKEHVTNSNLIHVGGPVIESDAVEILMGLVWTNFSSAASKWSNI
jgi:hypothetical protein